VEALDCLGEGKLEAIPWVPIASLREPRWTIKMKEKSESCSWKWLLCTTYESTVDVKCMGFKYAAKKRVEEQERQNVRSGRMGVRRGHGWCLDKVTVYPALCVPVVNLCWEFFEDQGENEGFKQLAYAGVILSVHITGMDLSQLSPWWCNPYTSYLGLVVRMLV
jgi:hypothetical protein